MPHRPRNRLVPLIPVLLALVAFAVLPTLTSAAVLLICLVAATAATAVRLSGAREVERPRPRPGRQDPWLNEVAVAAAGIGLAESARNTVRRLGGAPVLGDIVLREARLSDQVALFASDGLARQAETGLRANPRVRDSIDAGRTELWVSGRVLHVAQGLGGVVDELRMGEIARTVDTLALPPGGGPEPAGDPLQALARLGELRREGVVSEEEFAAKKAELLRRI